MQREGAGPAAAPSRAAATAVATTMASSPASAKPCNCSVRRRWTAKASSSGPSRSVTLIEGTIWPASMQVSARLDPHSRSGPAARSPRRAYCIAAVPAGVAAGPDRSVAVGSSQATLSARPRFAIISIPPALVSSWPFSSWPGSAATVHGETSIGDCCQSRPAPRSVRKTPTRRAGAAQPRPDRSNRWPTVMPSRSRVPSETATSIGAVCPGGTPRSSPGCRGARP
ncbi:hypothetical protein [Kitasatospora purpeofusca]|uniref:hypothetical protein n=1 Tax=Kitasatospora purpeofusca TaxID=67352 RepID=UPI003869712F